MGEGKDKYKTCSEIDVTIGNRIRDIRNKHGWSQNEFAQHISAEQYDFSSSKISKMENGQQPPTIAELVQISEVLNVNIMYFLGKNDSTVDELTFEYEVASKLLRLERVGRFVPEYMYRPDDMIFSIDLDFENYLLKAGK